MKLSKHLAPFAAVAMSALLTAGCIVSGTVVILEDISFFLTTQTGAYYYPVDVTDDEDWDEYKDNIDFIDDVSFTWTMNNPTGTNIVMNAYVRPFSDDPEGFDPTPPDPDDLIQIVKDLPVPAGTKSYSAAEGRTYLVPAGIDELKEILKTGQFDYFGYSTENNGDTITVEGTIIITVSGSE